MFKCSKVSKQFSKDKHKCLCVIVNNFVSSAKNVKELDPAYVPHKVELANPSPHYFQPAINSTQRFSLVLPPPNITGVLHLGHALTATIQDVLVRWKRMQGIETLWVPGIDHAGIATQVVVEKKLLKEQGKSRHDLGRDNFMGEVWKWKKEKSEIIGRQLRQLGVSLNWDREVFTMDPMQSKAVISAFEHLFEKDLIYRSDSLVNWSCNLQSAISDMEVEHKEINGETHISVPGYSSSVAFGSLFHFAYKVENSSEEIIVATTRPETLLGDMALAVHPNDERYKRFVGKKLIHPFRNCTIPVVADEFVDPEFGTGAVKVTPGHDHIDFQVAKRHGLDILQVIDERGSLTEACGEYSGIHRFQAREIILNRLSEMGLFRGKQDHKMLIPICSRSGDIVEFLVKPQWFVKCKEMATRALDDVREGRLIIEPKHFEKTWFNWLENIRDWCVSRQLWWGHRIPVYSCHTKFDPDRTIWVAADNLDRATAKAAALLSTSADNLLVRQDNDVLDTWFSSALQPFSVFGWPQQNKDLSRYYPLNIMETGHDILFFWVARMVMLGKELTGKLPFNRILLHGIICDSQGRKMSKSLGNVVAPEDIISGASITKLEEGSKASHSSGILSAEELKRAIEGQRRMFPDGIPECGADALRFTLTSHNIKNHFINFDVRECHVNKLFCNKIWQATKFAKLWCDKVLEKQSITPATSGTLSIMDKWILSRLSLMVDVVNKGMENQDFHLSTAALKNFLYYDLCDVYVEATKRGFRTPESVEASGHCRTLVKALDVGLRCLSPFMPHLTQHLHLSLPLLAEGIKRDLSFPKSLAYRDEALEEQVEDVLQVVVAIRRLKKIFNVTSRHQPKVTVVTGVSHYPAFIEVIQDLASCHEITVQANAPVEKDTIVDALANNVVVYLKVPEELRKAIEVDLPKLEKKKQTLLKDLDKMKRMISGSGYKSSATTEAQKAHSKKISQLEEKLSRINYISNFCK